MSDIVYALGLVSCSACVPKDWSRDQIESAVNAEHPTGIRNKWSISEDKTFKTGAPMPKPCEDDPEKMHWLLNC